MCGGFLILEKRKLELLMSVTVIICGMPAGGARLDESITGKRHGQKGNTESWWWMQGMAELIPEKSVW